MVDEKVQALVLHGAKDLRLVSTASDGDYKGRSREKFFKLNFS